MGVEVVDNQARSTRPVGFEAVVAAAAACNLVAHNIEAAGNRTEVGEEGECIGACPGAVAAVVAAAATVVVEVGVVVCCNSCSLFKR